MISLVGAILTAFMVSALVFPILIKYSTKKKIVDLPGRRRIHKRVTPSIGGVAIFLGFLTACIIWDDIINWPDLKTILGILFITFVLGLCDDLVHIKPIVKILGQVIAGSLAFFLVGTAVSSTYGLFFNVQFLPIVSYFFSVFAIVIISNSFNLIDGIDGLAGAFSTVSLIFFGAWFYLVGDINYAVLCFALVGGVAAFLVFNWEPSKIFMGDTGALLIGLALSMLAIRFLNTNILLPETSSFKFMAPLTTMVCVLIIPLVDTVRIILIRAYRGISPLTADKRHIHHYLLRLELSHQQATIILIAFQLLFIVIAMAFHRYRDIYLLPGIIAAAVLLCLLLDWLVARRISSGSPASAAGPDDHAR